ncbi:MAG TPA: retropepsin-like aspartic protease, partial [Terriglobales bacterium]|nr:retropepsin-like aspartic protease [Terriglobales bacterium]
MLQPRIALTLLAFICLSPRAFAASAEVPPAARAIIEHYLQATGGRAAFEAESTLHLKGRLVAQGMKGTYEAWVRQPGCLATRLTLGSLARRTGACGGTAWETDLASKRGHLLDGKDLESGLEEAWFETEQWARADGGGGTIALGSMSFAGRAQRQALEVTPPVGRPRTLWFDLRTGFLDRVRASRDHYEGEEWRADYRLMAGRKRSTAARPVGFSFDGENDGLAIDSVWANVPVPATLFEPPNPSSDAVAWLRSRGVARLPFRYESRAVWVRASINGAPPADFILDTGCSITALDRNYAMSLELPREGSSAVEGVGALAEASFSTVRRLRITAPDGDGVEVRGLKVSLVDLSEGMEPILWRKTAGLIGYDFISHFVLAIDYDRGILTFRDPAGFAYAGKGQAVP